MDPDLRTVLELREALHVEVAKRLEIEGRLEEVADALYRLASLDFGGLPSLRDDDSVLDGVVGCVVMLSEELKAHLEARSRFEHELEERVRQRTAELIEASRVKSLFLANMSHEIRTPLNGVTGMLDLLLDTEATVEQRTYITSALASSKNLLGVINDILDLTKIESGRMSFASAPFDLEDTLHEAIQPFVRTAREKGIELACIIRPDFPRRRLGDAGRVRQILVNLIGNAVKFTDRGSIVIRIDSAREGSCGEGDLVRFCVSDTGPGISMDIQAGLFKPFTQGDNTHTRAKGGTGLGLSISRQLAELMGGSIDVESEVGKGSAFRVTVRLPLDRRASHAEESSSDRVLVLEESEAQRCAVVESLNLEDGSIAGAKDVREALAKLEDANERHLPFDAVLIGHSTVEASFSAAAQIRAHARSAPRLILMTSGCDFVDHETLVTRGFSAHFTKPLFRRSFLGRLRAKGAAASEPRVQGADSGGLRVLLAEDNKVNQIVAQKMLERLGHQVSVASNGRECLSLFESQGADVILMDIQMPEMDGYEATRSIRQREEKLHMDRVPIIALTAHAMVQDRDRCLEYGMDTHLTKPLVRRELSEALGQYAVPANRTADAESDPLGTGPRSSQELGPFAQR